MKTNDDHINPVPDFMVERDVFGQIKNKGMSITKRFKYKLLNIPDLKVTYALLSTRAIATFIDLAIVLCALWVIEMFLFNFAYKDYNSFRFTVIIITWIFYNGLFESSVSQATIGEMMLKIKVIDLYGKRMSFIRASIRCISTIISILPFGLGVWYITTDSRRQGWHDLIAGSYVIKS
jgi:uncharacterized RDD family membrane protein YckC